jgi:4-oxalocrotonate tautomerase
MPLVNVKLVEGVFDTAQKQQIVRDLTEAMVAIEGENMRPIAWVIVEEVKSGDWGIAGDPKTTADVQALAAGIPVG